MNSVSVWDCEQKQFYMSFQKYVRSQWYRKSSNIIQIRSLCPKINF